MGGVHSRRTGPARIDKESVTLETWKCQLLPQFRLRVNPLAPSKSGYFILSFKTEKIKVVNADSAEISLLNQIIRRHTRIRSEGWERHMTWAFHLSESPLEL